MNFNNHKIPLISTSKAYLNSSIALAKANKLNKSRSILKNSVLRCALKENNSELAHNLAIRESELSDLRKENIRLLKENYDLFHTGQYRTHNFNTYMTKFSELSEVALALFANVCKLSDELVEMKNHPFLTGEDTNNESYNVSNEYQIPSPFASKDKIGRSPVHSLDEVNESNPDIVGHLASQIVKIKNQSNHSIQNLSINMECNTSFVQKTGKHRPDSPHYLVDQLPSPIKYDSPKISVGKNSKITIRRGDDRIPKRRKLPSQDDDPMFLTKGASKSKQRKKKNLTLKTDVKVFNKEEYKKHKENDAYHLSINETLNTTILPPSLNEFKNQQKVTEQVELGKEIVEKIDEVKEANQVEVVQKSKHDEVLKNQKVLKQTEPAKVIDVVKKRKTNKNTEVVKKSNVVKKSEVIKQAEPIEIINEIEKTSSKSPNSLNDKHLNNYFNDDDDDFILTKKEKTKKKNALDDSINDIDIDNRKDSVHGDHNKENNIKNDVKKPKSKAPARSKRAVKKVTDENECPDVIVVEKMRKRKNNIEKEDKAKVPRKQSNVSVIIDSVNADSNILLNVKDTVKGRSRKKKVLVEH